MVRKGDKGEGGFRQPVQLRAGSESAYRADCHGKDADVNNIDHKDDLEAASRVMLSPVSGEGKKLRQSIEKYRTLMGEMVEDSAKTRIIEAACRRHRLTRLVSIPALGKRLCSRICRWRRLSPC